MCIFCDIINNQINSYKIYEDDIVVAILDIAQVTTGHCLVIPKEHYSNIFELPDHVSSHIFKVVTHISKMLKEKLNFTDLNLLNNNGPLAEQTVNHFHIHIIPQYLNDNVSFFHLSKEPDFTKLENLYNKIVSK